MWIIWIQNVNVMLYYALYWNISEMKNIALSPVKLHTPEYISANIQGSFLHARAVGRFPMALLWCCIVTRKIHWNM